MTLRSVSLKLDVIDTMEHLVPLAPEWSDLWDSDPVATPFQSPSWLLPWTRNLWGGGRLLVLTFRNSGRLVRVAPLFEWGQGHVSWLGTGISDYLGITAAPGYTREVTEAMFEALSEMDWEVCDLEEQTEDSPLLWVQPPCGLVARTEDCCVCPVVEVCHEWRCPGRLAKTLRYSENRLRSLGDVRFEHVDPAELKPIFFRLHAARWKGEGVVGSDALQRFTPRQSRDRPRCTACGQIENWSTFSPGSLLLRYAIEDVIAEGAWAADFLRSAEPYKYRWGARDRWNRKVTVVRTRTPGICLPAASIINS